MACRTRTIAFLMLAYLLLTANLEVGNIILAMAIALGIMTLLPRQTDVRECRGFLSILPAAVQYAAILGWDLLVSGIQVARIVLDPKLPIQPGIVAIPTECRSDLGRALSAHAVTLTPGQLVVGIADQGTLFIHCLDVTDAYEEMSAAQKAREGLLLQIFLSPP